MKKIICLFLLLLVSVAHASGRIEIMSYNVENLFDAEHDEDKKDWSFLPKGYSGKNKACKQEKSKYRREECFDTDWTEQKVEFKINQIVDVVTKERNKIPDILALVEVENDKVVKKLVNKLGYQHFVMTSSPDNRGIDVALAFKNNAVIKYVQFKEHHVPVDYATRNILEVEFTINGHPLTVFVNHWPSLSNPDSWRIKAANVLANRTIEILKQNPSMRIIATGDFNTIPENNPHPFNTVLHKDNLYYDASDSFFADKSISDEAKRAMPKGTYYFGPKNQWNMLDRIFYNQNLLDKNGLHIDISSFKIYLPEFALKEHRRIGEPTPKLGGYELDDSRTVQVFKVPERFNSQAKTQKEMGFSDHFSVIVELAYP